MACSTCDGYEFVPNPDNPDGMLVDCPDCRAIDPRPLKWCPVHSKRLGTDLCCRLCLEEAARAVRFIERKEYAA
jgi:hypothetical protein